DHFLKSLVHHVAVALNREHERPGLRAFDAGRERRRAPMECLQNFHIEVIRERRVAADPEHADRALNHAELCDHFERGAHRDRLAATGTEVVRADVDQIGGEVAHERCRDRRRPAGRNDVQPVVFGHLVKTSSIRARRTCTSRSGAIPNPELSRLKPPMKSTGERPSTARRTSSIICPWLFSYTATLRAPSHARATASDGNGNSVTGRT